MIDAAQELASARILKSEHRPKALILSASDQPWFMPRNIGPPGAGPWKEISSTGTPLNWSYSYERELPSKAGQIKRGKTRRWSLRTAIQDNQMEWSQNSFPQYAAAFMLPAMQGYDKKRHGVDLLGRDFIVLGKLIYMLGVCIKCAAMHPEASVLASPLLDMLRSREISHHAEAYVRRSVLFAASCVLLALHPSYVATAVVEGNIEISEGLEWVRIWALQVAESDTDRECQTLAMACLQLHAEMALQASRALESSNDTSTAKSISLSPSVSKRSIKIPYLD
ncbi:UNVERIFIED_CONTAM: Telomere length regulation protein TEL2 [Sesamum latifolium]|uniref:Telomere length regulation protein TEL2 n=1 Tax=Sesamum latifolium TaxID=2727402 RepID=A0AAW2UG83_9LAMI